MDKEKILNILMNIEDKPSNDLMDVEDFLIKEFESTKELIINLTKHLDSTQHIYERINSELKKRKIR